MKTIMKIAAAGAFLLLAACGKEESEPVAEPALSVSPAAENLSFGAAAKELYTFEVTTNQPDWQAVSDQAWCKVEMDAAANSFTVSALPNDATSAPAPATITVSAGKAAPVTLTATQAAAEYDIYLAGRYRKEGSKETICYWKNGERIALTDGAETSDCTAITASEGSVYISGKYGTTPVYWKDGERFDLEGYYATNAIAVENGSVYVLGDDSYWKDNVAKNLDSPDFKGSAMVVTDGEVYIAGTYDNRIDIYAAYWTGGRTERLPLPDGLNRSKASSAALSGGSVYIGGYYNNNKGQTRPCYWKDGVHTQLDIPSGASFGAVTTLCMHNGTLYAAGIYGNTTFTSCCYWVDGVIKLLQVPDVMNEIVISGITVCDGKVYVAGYYRAEDWIFYPCYWVDGKRIDLETEPDAVDTRVCGIVLVKK